MEQGTPPRRVPPTFLAPGRPSGARRSRSLRRAALSGSFASTPVLVRREEVRARRPRAPPRSRGTVALALGGGKGAAAAEKGESARTARPGESSSSFREVFAAMPRQQLEELAYVLWLIVQAWEYQRVLESSGDGAGFTLA